jgi:hypothetical protein
MTTYVPAMGASSYRGRKSGFAGVSNVDRTSGVA